jgi:hypothetical protein
MLYWCTMPTQPLHSYTATTLMVVLLIVPLGFFLCKRLHFITVIYPLFLNKLREYVSCHLPK